MMKLTGFDKKKYLNLLRISILTFIFLSCVTFSSLLEEMDSAVEKDEFTTAIETIKKAQEKPIALYNEKNAVSLFLDKGLLEHYAGNYAASSEDLQNAERLIEEAYTKSISEGFFIYIINDYSKEYPGEDFENIYLNIFNALNYFNRGNTEGALAEIRKLNMTNGKLDMLARKYDYVDPKTGVKLNEMARRETGIWDIPKAQSVNFSNSALARYLSALFYQAEGNKDSARIEFDQIERAFNANKNIYQNQIPTAVEGARNVPGGMARLNIISFTGLSPIKEETISLQQLPFLHPVLQIATFRLPGLVRRPGQITRVEAVIEGHKFDLELLEDMGSVVQETYKARYSNILIRTYIRTIIKYAVADIAAIAAMAADQDEGMNGFLVALAARAATDASERADIRMSRYLPEKAYIGGINLNPGTYSVIINYYSGSHIIAHEQREAVVNTGCLNLIQTVKLK